ncbi:GxxExxY protein [Natronospira proteinivora]|uniref:GxxExxY protein n=1 Tax=Natronospira proteinivora TaxID=1807133 RepID=A0ABT1G5P3_9GAMM|nr:GxxExxY protein [Natronospira proteinivora]
MPSNQFDELSRRVIGCAIEVHSELGPGLLESAYERALLHELTLAGLSARRQQAVNVE